MDQQNQNFNSLSQTLLNTPVSNHSLFDNITTIKERLTDLDIQTFNEFDAAFALAPNSTYPEPHSGPESPTYSHSHDDTTGDESGDMMHPSESNLSSKPRTMETRKRKSGGARKTVQHQDQILKRRVQNRAAQRSFRERQKEYVHDLEHQVDLLKGEIAKLHDNYQDLLKAVTSAPRIPQTQLWSGDLSPATSLDELEYNEYNGSVDGSAFEPIKVEGNLWPTSTDRDYQGIFYN